MCFELSVLLLPLVVAHNTILLRNASLEHSFPITPYGTPFVRRYLLLDPSIQTSWSIAQLIRFPIK